MEECIVCFYDLNDYSKAILSCGHSFHLHCITQWKDTQNKKTYTKLCPICRDTEVEIINIIDGKYEAPKLNKKNNSSLSLSLSLYRRRNQSVPQLELGRIRRNSIDYARLNTNDHFFCCCTIL